MNLKRLLLVIGIGVFITIFGIEFFRNSYSLIGLSGGAVMMVVGVTLFFSVVHSSAELLSQ